jgi:hypothetical protein
MAAPGPQSFGAATAAKPALCEQIAQVRSASMQGVAYFTRRIPEIQPPRNDAAKKSPIKTVRASRNWRGSAGAVIKKAADSGPRAA